jgi:hypothetical protein
VGLVVEALFGKGLEDVQESGLLGLQPGKIKLAVVHRHLQSTSITIRGPLDSPARGR